MTVQQKEIVLLPYPFSDFARKKVRPAIVVSNNYLNTKSDDCIMIPLTSVIKEEPYSVLINQEDLSTGKLLQQSRARADKIFTIEKASIFMKIGMVNDKTFGKIKSEIEKMF
jgi:mRNA interferase MazF